MIIEMDENGNGIDLLNFFAQNMCLVYQEKFFFFNETNKNHKNWTKM